MKFSDIPTAHSSDPSLWDDDNGKPDFETWKRLLAVELAKTFDWEGGKVDGEQYIKDTGDDCWREAFDDGLSPADAASEEANAAR